MNIPPLEYGNPTQTDAAALRLQNYLDPLFEELRPTPCPRNDSLLVREELNMLREYMSMTESDQVIKQRYRKYDIGGMDYLRRVMIEAGAPEDDINRIIWGIVNDSYPLLVKLKMHYQRPRPFQLARVYRLTLFPYNSARANSPAYPSALTTQAALVTQVLTHRYPELAESLDVYKRDYALSRLYLGLHYPTDNDYAWVIADRILEDKEFKQRYGLNEGPRTVHRPGGETPDDPIGQVEPATGSGQVPPVLHGPDAAMQ